jgi:hypothetical protein
LYGYYNQSIITIILRFGMVLPQVLPDSWADVQAVHAGDELARKPSQEEGSRFNGF